MENGKVLAMFDIRGIQSYIFRTPKIKNAIGASAIVENIIEESLLAAIKKLQYKEDQYEVKWCTDEGPCHFKEKDLMIQVLYIGGGNAFVLFKNEDTFSKVNCSMSMYVLEQTYSLQLAVAYTKKTDSYHEDMKKLYQNMDIVKASSASARPIGAFPDMKREIKTGYPVVTGSGESQESQETLLKQKKTKEVLGNMSQDEKILDRYVTKKGVDSMLAVVHIDGNNMGLRINNLQDARADYETAVNCIRRISFTIDHAFKTVFGEMHQKIKEIAKKDQRFKDKIDQMLLRKILVAGDDITYICNASVALMSVQIFAELISDYGKYFLCEASKEDEEKRVNAISMCSGVAFVNSHFPFHIAYEVAEGCCRSAKIKAKRPENLDGQNIMNWVDFQFCKNIQTQDLQATRNREYVTSWGEVLTRRPYLISTEYDTKKPAEAHTLNELLEYVSYFKDTDNIPRSFAKEIRNTYSSGKYAMKALAAFLDSREWKMPDKSLDMYDGDDQSGYTAKWYDALELIDYTLDSSCDKENEEEEKHA